jgi:UPF0716 protein FxsA
VLRLLFLLLTLLPVIDIVLLVWIAYGTSVQFVLLLVIGTGILGVWLARHQGLRTLRRISEELDRGQMPAESLLDGLFVLVAGALLIVPGFLTDVLAIALLFPPSRQGLKAWFRRRLQARVTATRYTRFGSPIGRDQIIDVRVIENPP